MNTIWIVPLEPIDQRYTKQWFTEIPKLLLEMNTEKKFEVMQIDVPKVDDITTPGAFLDFAQTNIYKSRQMEYVSSLFNSKQIKSGDKFLFTDAWHFGIPQIRYMSDLLDIPVEIHAIWHAGAYDPTDILGKKMRGSWANYFEKSVFFSCNCSYFATEFHRNLFHKNLHILNVEGSLKSSISGQPHDAIIKHISKIIMLEKNKMKLLNGNSSVIFPHRLSPDKQPEIFEDLFKEKWGNVTGHMTQKFNMSKDKYYQTLTESRAVFSCALHENLGISMMEGVLAGCIPIVPDRASYSEMYLDCFKYPSEWTSSFDSYLKNKTKIMDFIAGRVLLSNMYKDKMEEQKKILIDKYLNANVMFNRLLEKQ